MAGISDTNTIDLVAEDAAGDVLVVMVEDRPWGADPDQEVQLREKVNLYADFIGNGSLVRQFPEAAGKQVSVRLDCVEEPAGQIATLIKYTALQLEQLGIGFVLNVRELGS